jgi:Zn-dependent protease with chaperone function
MKSQNGKKRIWLTLAVMGAIAIALGFIFPPDGHGPEFWFSHFSVFFAFLGFFGCVAMIYVAKWLGRYWLQRKEDYYD